MALTNIELFKRHLRMEGCELDEGSELLLAQYLDSAEAEVCRLTGRDLVELYGDSRFTQAVLMLGATFHNQAESEAGVQLRHSPAFTLLVNGLKRHHPGKL